MGRSSNDTGKNTQIEGKKTKIRERGIGKKKGLKERSEGMFSKWRQPLRKGIVRAESFSRSGRNRKGARWQKLE